MLGSSCVAVPFEGDLVREQTKLCCKKMNIPFAHHLLAQQYICHKGSKPVRAIPWSGDSI